MLSAQSDIAREVDSAFAWIGGICLVLLVGITLAMVLFLVRYRRSRHPRPARIEGHLGLEITWIVIPTLLVLFMFFKGYKGFRMMRDVPPNAMVVDVVAQRWFWTFTYPAASVSADQLYVPVDRPVKLQLTSPETDVVHSLYLPAFRVKEDCVPGRGTYLWFQAERVGIYNIFCAEYCGRDHSSMLTKLHVLSPPDYERWLADQIAAKNKPIVIEQAMDPRSEDIVACDAPSLFRTYCVSCHGADGTGGLIENARDFTRLDGWKRSSKVTDIYRTLSLGIEGTQMRPFPNLRPWDRFALAHHVAAFYAAADRPVATDEEIQALVKEYALDQLPIPRDTISIEESMHAIAAEAAAEEGG
ncbi:MAG: cytochrome c oxidase subunit II [Planctomycetota bacterium]